MPTTRTQHYTNTLSDLNGPRVGVNIALTLHTPEGKPVANLDGQTVFDGTQDAVTTNSSGVYDVSGWALADLPVGCYYSVDEGGYDTTITSTTYSGTAINVFTLYPTAVVTNRMLMKATIVNLGVPISDFFIYESLSDKAVNAESETLVGGVQVPIQTDSNGIASRYLDITSTLTPSDVVYLVQWGAGGFQESFTVPDHPHGWQGSYAGGTTYNRHSGTQVSPADVVLWTDGKWYRYINATPGSGHDPSNATYWVAFDGEPIEWNIVASGAPSTRAYTAAQITALAAIPLAYAASPATVQDVLSNQFFAATFTAIFKGATDDPTATYTAQIGRYEIVGKRCRVTIVLVTSTMSKTTLTDNVRVLLPIAAANIANHVQLLTCRLENGTAVKVATQAETVANAAYLQLRQVSEAAASALLTYGTGDLGVLTHTITCVITGEYETV